MPTIERATPLLLQGDAYARGRQQAALSPGDVPAVRRAVQDRLSVLGRQLESPAIAAFLAAQWAFARDHDGEGLDETRGIADGFGIAAETLFAYLHANVVSDMLRANIAPAEGCTSWAAAAPGGGAWVVKNRDYRGEHGALQRVFRHEDPGWSGRAVLCVGSLGSPGAFSSGMNSDGLAVVDTQIATRDHGVGCLRYFLISHLLRTCRSVDDALARIAALPHAGGGSLVLGDAGGNAAAVELGHRLAQAEGPSRTSVVRTNHFTGGPLAATALNDADDELASTSAARRARVGNVLQARRAPMDLEAIQSLMAVHDEGAMPGLCRHPRGDGARTLSTAIYDTRIASLVMSVGAPCSGAWRSYELPGDLRPA